jgi:hypothetical protein
LSSDISFIFFSFLFFLRQLHLTVTSEESDSESEIQPSVSGSWETSAASSSSAPATSSSTSSSSDPDFVPPECRSYRKKDEIVLTLDKKKWIKTLIPHADRGKWSNADIFRFCAATIQAGGADLAETSVSEETIRLLRIESETEIAKTIKVRKFRTHL